MKEFGEAFDDHYSTVSRAINRSEGEEVISRPDRILIKRLGPFRLILIPSTRWIR